MKFIKSHKTAIVITTICLILVVLAGVAFYKLMFPSNAEDANGDRLVNAPEVDQAIIEQILGGIKENKGVVSATYNKNVRILKFIIDTKDMKLNNAKKLVSVIENKLNNEVLEYYDIEVFLTQENGKDYPCIGYRAKGIDTKDTKEEDKHVFKWSYNGVGKNE